MKIDVNGFDLVDFGCGNGGSFQYAKGAFGTKKCLGIDIRPIDVGGGLFYKTADLMNCEFEGVVDCSSFCHMLEHVKEENERYELIEKAANISRKFVFFTNPAWDCVDELAKWGLRFYWQDFTDHYKITILSMHNLLVEMGMPHTIMAEHFFKDSTDVDIHTMGYYANTHYDAKKDPPKPNVRFEKKMFKMLAGFVWTGQCNRNALLALHKDSEIIFDWS